nr:unnamed protein product [Callosobruchus analis]
MSTTEGVDEIVARTRELVIERGQIKASLTRFISYLDRHSNRQVDVLKSRLEHTEQLFKEFNRVQAALEVLDESELETEEREQFEERFFNAIAKAKQFIAQSEANNQVETRTADHGRMPINQGSGGGKGFPTIDLIKFNGPEHEEKEYFRLVRAHLKAIENEDKTTSEYEGPEFRTSFRKVKELEGGEESNNSTGEGSTKRGN